MAVEGGGGSQTSLPPVDFSHSASHRHAFPVPASGDEEKKEFGHTTVEFKVAEVKHLEYL